MSHTLPNADDELRHEIHMKMLSKSKSAKDLGELTVVPLGFAVSIALDLLRKSNLQRAIEELQRHDFQSSDDYTDRQYVKDRIAELQAELQQIEKEGTL